MKKRAFISVYDKENIVDFVQELVVKHKFEIVSTGGTYKLLKQNGIKAIEVSELTNSPEMLSGKVKSLHPTVFAGILADVTNSKEVAELEKFSIQNFDMVVVNLYPFEEVALKTDNVNELVKNIDIGGVSLLRAAAKNYKNVTVVCDKSDYAKAVEGTDEKTRQELALKAFALTSNYDSIIGAKLSEIFGGKEIKTFAFEKIQDLRYGENPHQKAGLYSLKSPPPQPSPSRGAGAPFEANYDVLWGKELSYNNILDMTAAVNIVSEFYDVPAVAIVKHTAPCGVALGKNIFDAYTKAFDCDPVSAFGGIVAFTQKVNVEIAKHLNSVFLEVVIAPDFDEKALEILEKKKNLRIVKLNTSLQDYKKLMTKEKIGRAHV